jgi:hypothetical protein
LAVQRGYRSPLGDSSESGISLCGSGPHTQRLRAERTGGRDDGPGLMRRRKSNCGLRVRCGVRAFRGAGHIRARIHPAKASLSRSSFVTLRQFLHPHRVLQTRDRCRTITPLLLLGVLPEPVHATRAYAETSTITQLARVPGKELP